MLPSLNASHCLHSTFGKWNLVAPATIWNALLHIKFVMPSTVLILTESDFRAESILVTQNLYLQQKKKKKKISLSKLGATSFPPSSNTVEFWSPKGYSTSIIEIVKLSQNDI